MRRALRGVLALLLLLGVLTGITALATSASAVVNYPYLPGAYPSQIFAGYDRPEPMDYNGDGYTDPAIVRNTGGIYTWYVYPYLTSGLNWGGTGDIPVPGNYSAFIQKYLNGAYVGDNRDNIAIWRPVNGTFYIQGNDGVMYSKGFGSPGDIPWPTETESQSQAGASNPVSNLVNLGVYRQSNNTYYWLSNISLNAVSVANYHGSSSPMPVATISTFRPYEYRPTCLSVASLGCPPAPAVFDAWTDPPLNDNPLCSSGLWGSAPCNSSSTYGNPGDMPFAFNWGNQLSAGNTNKYGQFDTLSVYRPSNGTWYIRAPGTNISGAPIAWGSPGDYPVPGNYNGTHAAGHAWTNVAVYRPCTGVWYIKGNPGVADLALSFGNPAPGGC